VTGGRLDISMTPEEIEAYLGERRTIRLATVGADGEPHVVPLWFVWTGGAVFMNSTLGNVTLRNLAAHPAATGSVDDGESYGELRGVLIHGPVEPTADDPRLPAVAEAWSNKYLGGNPVPYTRWRNRVWLRQAPVRLTSWDFRKIPAARAARAEREA
jgi:nitroimidazol reductase NimA-like FMN-containing flavoprotein (pyridoxamine 5'-phosphate oxidase superfamily)